MANITEFIESGTAATQDFSFWNQGAIVGGNGGAVTSSSQAVDGSVRSFLCASGTNSPTSGDTAITGQSGILADAGRRITFYMRFNGTPAPASGVLADFCDITTAAQGDVFGLGLNSSRKLVVTTTGAATATGTTVLATNTDYRISIVYTITSSSVNSIKVYINGVLEITVTNTAISTGSDTFFLGWGFYNNPGINMNIYFAHIFIDNGTSGDTGDVNVTAKLPYANGTTNGFTGSGTPSSYGSGNARYVNYRPLQTATANVNIVGAGSAVTEEYNIESALIGDEDINGLTVIDWEGWLYAKSLSSETGSIIVGGSTSNISLTSTTTLFKKIAGLTSYPAGTGSDIGIVTTTALTTVTLYDAGIIIAYVPGTPTPGATNVGSLLSFFNP